MIIKNDFVTNSSSTIWIVYVPESYLINLDEFEEQLKQNYFDETLDDLKDLDIASELEESLTLLKEGDNVWSHHIDGLHYAIYDTLIAFLSNDGYAIKAVDASEGNNMIVGLNQGEAKAAFLKSIDIDETFKFLSKGEKSEEDS